MGDPFPPLSLPFPPLLSRCGPFPHDVTLSLTTPVIPKIAVAPSTKRWETTIGCTRAEIDRLPQCINTTYWSVLHESVRSGKKSCEKRETLHECPSPSSARLPALNVDRPLNRK